MRTTTTATLLSACMLTLGICAPAAAQERHAVSPDAVSAAVVEHADGIAANRAAIRAALSKPEVRAVAERAGIDIDRAAASLDSLDSATTARAAEAARQVNDALVGGASTITISTTTIIIVLLLIILIVVAA